ncbi:MAG: DUF5615 family PIN-like protein [Isosphaeraceae bacterium]
MILYLDEHVPRAIAEGLRLRGIDVLTVQEDGLRGYPDPAVLDRATELGRVVFTQDPDFIDEANRRLRQGVPFGGVVYCHQRRLTVGSIIQELQLIATCAEPAEVENRVTYLPL